MLEIAQKQNTQTYKMSIATKCPKLQNFKIKKLKNVQKYKMFKITKCPRLKNIESYNVWLILFLCSFE